MPETLLTCEVTRRLWGGGLIRGCIEAILRNSIVKIPRESLRWGTQNGARRIARKFRVWGRAEGEDVKA